MCASARNDYSVTCVCWQKETSAHLSAATASRFSQEFSRINLSKCVRKLVFLPSHSPRWRPGLQQAPWGTETETKSCLVNTSWSARCRSSAPLCSSCYCWTRWIESRWFPDRCWCCFLRDSNPNGSFRCEAALKDVTDPRTHPFSTFVWLKCLWKWASNWVQSFSVSKRKSNPHSELLQISVSLFFFCLSVSHSWFFFSLSQW